MSRRSPSLRTSGTRLRVAAPFPLLCLAAMTAFAASSATEAPGNSSLVTAARSELLQRLHRSRPDLGRIELTATGPVYRNSLTAGQAVIPVNAVQSTVLAPRMCVWLEVRRHGRSVESVPVWFSVTAYRSVLVTQRSRAAREAVGTDEIVVEERDVAPLSDIPLPLDTTLARMRMRRAVMTGHVLLNSDIEEIPAVLRGQEVAVDVKHGTVAIETSAVALREARLGEPVMLQNPTSHETYMAHVVGNGRAEVLDR
jgi:flagella basal body P-ring formation protein FlgA